MRVRCRQQGSVWRIGLEPGGGARTLINAQGVRELRTSLEETDRAAARVIVLEGSTAGFCEGLDLAALLDAVTDPSAAIEEFAHCLWRLRQARALVISCIDGPCAGGGVGLAAAADIIICTARSSFVLPELVLGLLPALVLPLLLQRMTPQKARLLCLGKAFDGQQALALGLVDHVVEDPAQLEPALRGWIKHGLRIHPAALDELGQLCTLIEQLPRDQGLSVCVDRSRKVLGDPERRSGLRDFLDGEPLPWFERYWREAPGTSRQVVGDPGRKNSP